MNLLQEFDTIAAIATPMGMGGVGVIRISGEKAFDVIEKIFTNPKFEPRKFNHGWIVDCETKLDEVFYEVKLNGDIYPPKKLKN